MGNTQTLVLRTVAEEIVMQRRTFLLFVELGLCVTLLAVLHSEYASPGLLDTKSLLV